MVLNILTKEDSILKEASKEVEDIKNPEIQRLISDMRETLKNTDNGIGLAASQVGKSLRIAVIIYDDADIVLINPELKKKSWKKSIIEEGCLSIPHIYIPVKRSKSVKIKYLNENGEKKELESEGLLSRIIQHEIDHLNGILITDRRESEMPAIVPKISRS